MSHATNTAPPAWQLSEILRLPLWGSPPWKRQLAESGLPANIQKVISRTLTRCRLSREETATVASELIAHFADGLDRGQTAAKLIDDFGDPDVAAPLIQSSKKRNRPMWKKALSASGIGLAGIAAAYVFVSIWFHLGKPAPSVDYVAKMNQTIIAAPESDKAWPIYRPMWTKYGFSEGGGFDIPEMWFELDDTGDKRLIRADDPGWESAITALEQHADLLNAFRAGARKPVYGIELKNDPTEYSDEDFAAIYPGRTRDSFNDSADIANVDGETIQLMNESVVMVLLPHVQVLRTAARIFVVDARIAVAEKDPERAIQDLETMLGLARHAAEGPILVCSLVGYAIAEMSFSQIEEILTETPEFFDDRQLARLQKAVVEMEVRDWLHLEGERMMLADMIQRTYTDDGNGDGRITPQGLKILTGMDQMLGANAGNRLGGSNPAIWNVAHNVIGPASLFVAATRRELTEKAESILDAAAVDAKRPFWEAEFPDTDKMLGDERTKFALLSMLLPAVEQVRAAMDRIAGRQEGVLGAIALQRHWLKTGEWAKSWDQIPGSILGKPPIDQFNGKPLKLQIVEDRPRIYSIGDDREDDGGKPLVNLHNGEPVETQPRNFANFSPTPADPSRRDGDWIVWPSGNRN